MIDPKIKTACWVCCPMCDEKKCVGRFNCPEIKRFVEKESLEKVKEEENMERSMNNNGKYEESRKENLITYWYRNDREEGFENMCFKDSGYPLGYLELKKIENSIMVHRGYDCVVILNAVQFPIGGMR